MIPGPEIEAAYAALPAWARSGADIRFFRLMLVVHHPAHKPLVWLAGGSTWAELDPTLYEDLGIVS